VTPASAQVNLVGYWNPIFDEDWLERIPGPDVGDYAGLLITDAARKRANTWEASILTGPVAPPGRGPEPVAPEGWPTITSAEPMTFYFNGEDVRFVPLKPSHTNGDVAVYFTKSDVWAFGDVYTTDYPSIGVAQGGSIENFIDNYNKALELTPNTTFLPGHAQLSTRADLIANRDAISIIHDRFVKMVAQGMTLEQIRASRPSKEFDARFATGNFAPNDLQNSTRWYEQMFTEARTHLAPSR
jgi:glyoxylase-like metal-dependent hydrolase (beta-lactamase superfamily II)